MAIVHQKRTLADLEHNGRIEQLSDEDLCYLALGNIGTGKERKRVVETIKVLIAERSLSGLLSLELGELLSHQECNPRVAARLLVVAEMARRFLQPPIHSYQITGAGDVNKLVGPAIRYLPHEEMHVLVLNTKNCVVADVPIYRGTVNSTVVRIAEILQPAISRKCPNLIVCHNHPSGNPDPSPEDQEFTRQLVAAGRLLDIHVLDHIIVGNPGCVSLKERMNW